MDIFKKIVDWFNSHFWLGLAILFGIWFFPVSEEYTGSLGSEKPTGKKYNIFGFTIPKSLASAFASTGTSYKKAQSEAVTNFTVSDAHDDYFYFRDTGSTAESSEKYVISKYGDFIKPYIADFEISYRAMKEGKNKSVFGTEKTDTSLSDKLVDAFEKSRGNKALDDFYSRASSVEK